MTSHENDLFFLVAAVGSHRVVGTSYIVFIMYANIVVLEYFTCFVTLPEILCLFEVLC